MAAAAARLRPSGTAARIRRLWTLFAASALSWGIGETIWTWYEVFQRQESRSPPRRTRLPARRPAARVVGVLTFTSSPTRLATRQRRPCSPARSSLCPALHRLGDRMGNVYRDVPAVAGSLRCIAPRLSGRRHHHREPPGGRPAPARRAEVGRMPPSAGWPGVPALADSAFAYMTATEPTVRWECVRLGWFTGLPGDALAPSGPRIFRGRDRRGAHRALAARLPWVAVLVAALTVISRRSPASPSIRSERARGWHRRPPRREPILTHRDSLDLLGKSHRRSCCATHVPPPTNIRDPRAARPSRGSDGP